MALRVAILTVSDRSARGERPDSSGPALVQAVTELGWQVTALAVVPDEVSAIQAQIIAWCGAPGVDVVLTTGGTGFAPRDVTPEATLAVIERAAPGIAEAIRQESLRITPHAMLSRAVAGIRGRTVIINLPGSPKGAVESLRVAAPVLPHAVELLQEQPSSEAGHTR